MSPVLRRMSMSTTLMYNVFRSSDLAMLAGMLPKLPVGKHRISLKLINGAYYFFHTGTGGQDQPPAICAQGHYCPLGTQHSDQYPCPAGTWTNQTNLAASEECYVCPRGYYCLEASTAPTALCPTGHYCPAGKRLVSYNNTHQSPTSHKKLGKF